MSTIGNKPNVRMMFNRIAQRTTEMVGSPKTFLFSLIGIVLWFLSGPYFHYSDAWQLFLNTGLSIGTFLIVLLLQNNQNREGKAVQLKLDELIRGAQGTRNALVNLEEFSEEELEALQNEFRMLRERNCPQRSGDVVSGEPIDADVPSGPSPSIFNSNNGDASVPSR